MTSHKFNFNQLYLSKEKKILGTNNLYMEQPQSQHFVNMKTKNISQNMILLWNEMHNAEISGCFLLLE